jgi:hypothetical protein
MNEKEMFVINLKKEMASNNELFHKVGCPLSKEALKRFRTPVWGIRSLPEIKPLEHRLWACHCRVHLGSQIQRDSETGNYIQQIFL